MGDDYKIELISAVEAIRRRPALYVGPLDDPGLFNRLIQESLCLAADESKCGYCTEIRMMVHPSGPVIVRDNGRGLPTTTDQEGRPWVERLLTRLYACRDSKEDRRLAARCCGAGLVAVNALSEWLRIRNFREGVCWSQDYDRGQPAGPPRPESATAESGVELSFLPDARILGRLSFDARGLAGWFVGLGVRCRSLTIESGAAASGLPVVVVFEGIAPRCDVDNGTAACTELA